MKRERKLSEAEKKRLEMLEKKTQELQEAGYVRRDLIIDIRKANLFMLGMMIPIYGIGLYLFFACNRDKIRIERMNPFQVLIVYFVLVAIHELIHGLTWSIFSQHHFRDIGFSIMSNSLTPYCTCSAPLRKGQYICGALMPLFLLGILPTVYAILQGSFPILLMGLVMILTAGGDILIAARILNYRSAAKETIWLDHPTEAGIIVFER